MPEKIFIKEVYEYTLNTETYKGTCKVLKVAKEFEESLLLENGQEISKRRIIDRERQCKSHLEHDIQYYLATNHQVFTIEKFSGISKLFKDLKAQRINDLEIYIKACKTNISKSKKDLDRETDTLNKFVEQLKILKGE